MRIEGHSATLVTAAFDSQKGLGTSLVMESFEDNGR